MPVEVDRWSSLDRQEYAHDRYLALDRSFTTYPANSFSRVSTLTRGQLSTLSPTGCSPRPKEDQSPGRRCIRGSGARMSPAIPGYGCPALCGPRAFPPLSAFSRRPLSEAPPRRGWGGGARLGLRAFSRPARQARGASARRLVRPLIFPCTSFFPLRYFAKTAKVTS